MSTYKSVLAQSLHYLSRPHSKIPSSPIVGPATWRGRDLKSSLTWIHSLTETQKDDFDHMLTLVERAGKNLLSEISSEECPLPSLQTHLKAWRNEIMNGRGFVVIRGLPVEKYSLRQCETIFWCLGLHLGIPGAQNQAGDLLTHVFDEGKTDADFARLYKTSAAIAYHCDAADIVGLLCIQNSKSGGRSRIASSVTVFNEFLKQYPDDAGKLFSNFYLDARGENGMDYFAIPPLCHHDGNLRTFYHSDYFRSAKRYNRIKSRVEKRESILDRYEKIALSEDLYLEMDLRPGDMQFISNHTIIHARTAFEDQGESTQKRHLLRLWISAPERESIKTRVLRHLSCLRLLTSLVAAKMRK